MKPAILSGSGAEEGKEYELAFSPGGSLSGTLEPETLMALGGALGQMGRVSLGFWGGARAKMLAQAAGSGLAASGAQVLRHDLETPAQSAWLGGKYAIPASLFIQQEGEAVYLHLFDRDGLSLDREARRRLGQDMARGAQSRGARVGESDQIHVGRGDYVRDVVRRSALGHRPLRHITLAVPGDSVEERALRQCLEQFGCTVARDWQKGIPAFGAEHGGFYLTAQDERGALLEPEQLLALLCLVEMENGAGKVALTEGAGAAAELVVMGFGGSCLRLERDGEKARQLYAAQPWLWDSCFAAVRIASRMAVTGERLESLMAKTPRFSTRRREVRVACDQEKVLRELGRRGGGSYARGALRLREGGGWVCLMPLAGKQAVRVVAESADMEVAAELCDLYVRRCALAEKKVLLREQKKGMEN